MSTNIFYCIRGAGGRLNALELLADSIRRAKYTDLGLDHEAHEFLVDWRLAKRFKGPLPVTETPRRSIFNALRALREAFDKARVEPFPGCNEDFWTEAFQEARKLENGLTECLAREALTTFEGSIISLPGLHAAT